MSRKLAFALLRMDESGIQMKLRKIPGSGYDNDTQNKILDEATKLFALNGVGAVSMRDIAKASETQTSTIYYYYESKELLLEDVLARFEKSYLHYFEWLKEANAKVESVEELMDNMFNKELLKMLDPMNCLGMSLAIKEHHRSSSARKRFFELFFEHSLEYMQADFDNLAEKGIIPRTNTKIIAAIFMSCVMVGNDIRIHKYAGVKPPVNYMDFFDDLKVFLTSALKKGI